MSRRADEPKPLAAGPRVEADLGAAVAPCYVTRPARRHRAAQAAAARPPAPPNDAARLPAAAAADYYYLTCAPSRLRDLFTEISRRARARCSPNALASSWQDFCQAGEREKILIKSKVEIAHFVSSQPGEWWRLMQLKASVTLAASLYYHYYYLSGARRARANATLLAGRARANDPN